jgi:hypothetical protein
MIRRVCLATSLAVLGLAVPVQAQGVGDGGADVPAASAIPDAGNTPDTSMIDEIDQAAGTPITNRPTASGSSTPAPQPFFGGAKAFQSLNPDISVIVDSTAGFADHAPYSLAGDDPDLKGGSKAHPAGITVQEAEVGFQSVVDPYFRADVFLTIPNLQGLEVEEAFVTTTALPLDLQLKAGIFRSAFGRQNGQHLHVQDFTRRPLVNAAYLGTDGFRAPGVQLSYLVPTPFYLSLIAEAFSSKAPDDLSVPTTFGGGKRTDLSTLFEAKLFIPATESLSVYGGLNAGFGRGNVPRDASIADGRTSFGLTTDAPTQLYAADLYVKLKPPNVAGGYYSVAWQTEAFLRRTSGNRCFRDSDGACLPGAAPPADPVRFLDQTDGGFYTQLVVQVARSWILGVREDLLGLPTSDLQPRVNRASLSATYITSEFARLRLYGEREDVSLPSAPLGDGTTTNYAAFLQLEIAMGAHGAHPF